MNREWSMYLAKQYGISIEDDLSQAKGEYTVQDLIEQKVQMREFLEAQSSQMNHIALAVTGTLFAKRYSVLSMGVFDALIRYQIILDTSPQHMFITRKDGGEMGFVLPETAVKLLSELSDHEVEVFLSSFVYKHLTPLFQRVSEVSRSKTTHLFSQISYNTAQKALQLKMDIPEKALQIDRQWKRLLEVPAGCDRTKKNPLAMEFRLYHPSDGSSPYYIRKHCCLAYIVRGGDKSRVCDSCPLLSDDERD
ncbi:hypothetical protein [Brevibacillus centrosporus]|uniref:hypothetical protein n=1 Tax=Brevibacillus centrosporus TaxID=54910 RepID=UPI003811C74E